MTDKELIMRLGGVSVVSEHLGVTYQCVYNWLTRGIPSKVKVDNRALFLSDDPQPLNNNEQQPEEA